MTANTDNIERAGPADVVVGIDDSPSSHAALEWAGKWARSMGSRLRAVHVHNAATSSPLVWTTGFPAMAYVAEIPNRKEAENAISAIFRATGPEPDWALEFRDGSAGRALVSASAAAQLLVVGTREHVGLGRLISGSVSHYCLTHAMCPVAAIPPTSPRRDEAAAIPASHDRVDAAATGGAR
jgi:nucleotide-binding universal stress UspA family protein